MDATEALARRFPDHAWQVRRLQLADATFRAICEDYAEALRARDYWGKAQQSGEKKAEEYRRLVEELEAEALAILQAAKHSA